MKYKKITRKGEFTRAYAKGKSFVSPFVVVYIFKRRTGGGVHIGVTTSKKVGNAVERNRARRVIIAALDAVPITLERNLDIVFVARTAATHIKSQKMQTILKKQFGLAGILKDNSGDKKNNQVTEKTVT